ncbi:hypothetical protein N9H37_00050 [Congregibacter sp.]|nr:hypothetical protein [Congregibacter sp.]MDA8961735.1 hypothetical protein [Congregibacter sp.]
MPNSTEVDTRTPSPPFGYSRICTLDPDEQITAVAKFHAHQIRPNRIAYRLGIDIAYVEALIAGEVETERFTAAVAANRKQRYHERIKDSSKRRGAGRYELQQQIEKDFQHELAINGVPRP